MAKEIIRVTKVDYDRMASQVLLLEERVTGLVGKQIALEEPLMEIKYILAKFYKEENEKRGKAFKDKIIIDKRLKMR